MSIPANATEAPSMTKVWRQVKGNTSAFILIWCLVASTSGIGSALFTLLYETAKYNNHHTLIAQFVAIIGSLPITLLSGLAVILITGVPAIYYTTDRCPKSGEIFDIILNKPLRLLLAGFLFPLACAFGYLLCIVPGILVSLAYPLYVHYVFTTDLTLINCFSKALKKMFQNFGSFFIVSLLSFLVPIIVIIVLFLAIGAIGFLIGQMLPPTPALVLLGVFALPVSLIILVSLLIIMLSMRELYLQNYIHYKGLVRAREPV